MGPLIAGPPRFRRGAVGLDRGAVGLDRGAVGLDRGALEGAVLEGSVEPLRSREGPCER